MKTPLLTPPIKAIINEVEDIVCDILEIPRDIFFSKSQSKQYSRPRFIIYFLLHSRCGFTVKMISDIYGKDRTTIAYGIRQSKALKLDRQFWGERVDKLGKSAMYFVDNLSRKTTDT